MSVAKRHSWPGSGGFGSVLAIGLLFFCAPVRAENTQTLSVDLDGDGKIETLKLDARRDPALSIWHGKKRIWQGIPRRWASWKMLIGDVDGNGKRDIILGVHKTTRYLPFPHNCLFVWGFDGREAYKMWLGSSLSKPFSDFLIADIDSDGKAELIALEKRRDGKQCIVTYSWIGFGFGADWEGGGWDKAKLKGVKKNQVLVEVAGKTVAVSKP